MKPVRNDLDRRQILGAFAATAAAATASAPARAATGSHANLDDPQENLRTYIRMRGDLSGKTVVERVEARTFGVIEKKLPIPLFAAVGIQVSRFLPDGDRFRFKYRYYSLTTDLATGRPMETLVNPYTGARNKIPPRITQPGEILITRRGWEFTNKPNDAAVQSTGGLVRPWARMGDQLHLTDTLVSPPRFEMHPAFQLFTYMSAFDQGVNRSAASVASSFAGTGMEDWRDWMEIDSTKHDGSLAVHMTGRKVAGRAAFPDWLLASAASNMPGLFNDL